MNHRSGTSHAQNLLTFFKRWLGMRLEFIGGLITFFACLFAIIGRDNSDSSLTGLSISYALSVNNIYLLSMSLYGIFYKII